MKTILMILFFFGCALAVYLCLGPVMVGILNWIDRQFSDALPDDNQMEIGSEWEDPKDK